MNLYCTFLFYLTKSPFTHTFIHCKPDPWRSYFRSRRTQSQPPGGRHDTTQHNTSRGPLSISQQVGQIQVQSLVGPWWTWHVLVHPTEPQSDWDLGGDLGARLTSWALSRSSGNLHCGWARCLLLAGGTVFAMSGCTCLANNSAWVGGNMSSWFHMTARTRSFSAEHDRNDSCFRTSVGPFNDVVDWCICKRADVRVILKVLQLWRLESSASWRVNRFPVSQGNSVIWNCTRGARVYCLPLILLMILRSSPWQSRMNWSAMNLAKESTTLHQSIWSEHQPLKIYQLKVKRQEIRRDLMNAEAGGFFFAGGYRTAVSYMSSYHKYVRSGWCMLLGGSF